MKGVRLVRIAEQDDIYKTCCNTSTRLHRFETDTRHLHCLCDAKVRWQPPGPKTGKPRCASFSCDFRIIVCIKLQRLSHRNLVRRDTGHDDERIVRQHPRRTIVPALTTLLTTVCVTHSIHDPVDAPDRAQDSGSYRPPESRDQERADDGRVILAEVLVRALGRVEGQHGLLRAGRRGLDLLVRGVFEGVRYLGRFAEGPDATAVPGTDEKRADDGAEDITGSCQAMFCGALPCANALCACRKQAIGFQAQCIENCESELTRTRRG